MNFQPDPIRLKFPKSRRLRSSLDFARIYALKQQSGDGVLLLFGSKNEIGTTRIGLSVSKKHGNSIVRHRLRRLLKEAYRLEQNQVPEGLDLILIPRVGVAANLDNFRNSLVTLSWKLQRRWTTEEQS